LNYDGLTALSLVAAWDFLPTSGRGEESLNTTHYMSLFCSPSRQIFSQFSFWLSFQKYTVRFLAWTLFRVLKSSFKKVHSYRPSIFLLFLSLGGRNSSVGIETHYGLDGPRFEARWGVIFSAPLQTGPGAHSVFYTMGTGSFPLVNRPGRGVDYPPPSSAEVKERVELYICSPSGYL
jgi:hypothetical protein